MDPSRRNLLAATPGLALLAAGCPKVDLGKAGKAVKQFLPKVRFDRVKLRDIDFERAKLTFLFQVDNPAPLKVALSSFSYALDLEGERAFDGRNPDGVSLEPKGTAPLKFPFTLRWESLVNLLKATRGKDRLNFGLAGHMGFNTPVGEAKLPYDAGGDVPALRRPKFALKGLKVRDLNLVQNRARLAVQIDATNLGGERISFSGFDYDLRLAGERVANGVVERLGGVDGDGTERLELPIDLTLTSLGSGVVQAIKNRGDVRAQLGANLKVGTPFGPVPLSIDEGGNLRVR